MSSALIGHTGFIGRNLAQQRPFDALYNSKNFEEMRNREFDLVVCAGVSAVKWMANREPDEDRRRISQLEDVLSSVRAARFVLVSTIDVYPVTSGVDESFDCASRPNHAYGTNRLAFERFVASRFSGAFVVRLPGMFGPGLKKNVIFDLLNDNCLDVINPASSFQYYSTGRLWRDITRQLSSDVRLLNYFTEPISTRTIIDRFFPGKQVGQKPSAEAHYDLHTRHSALWGRTGQYACSADEVLSEMADFIRTYTRDVAA